MSALLGSALILFLVLFFFPLLQGFCGVDVRLRSLNVNGHRLPVVWVAHNFAFLGGSLGCAEGERITRAFEYAKEHGMPIVVQVRRHTRTREG